jgi:Bacterial membrane protein YfhO
VLLAGFFAREAIFEGRAFYLRDLHLQWFGQVESFVAAVASGAWPLWDPYVSFGQPMLANANFQVLYPPTWLNLLMRPWAYYTLYFVGHLVVAGAGAAAVLRRWGASPAGCFVGAGAWMASGPFLSLGNLWNHLGGAAWMPWAVLAADHVLAGSRRAIAGWALALAAMILAGSPDLFLLSLVPCGALVITRLDWRRPAAPGNGLLLLAVAVALAAGAGLAAAQLLPSLELAARSSRSLMGIESRLYWSLHPAALVQALLPLDWNALAWSDGVRSKVLERREPYLLSLHIGLPVLVLASGALATRALPQRRVLALSAIACVLLALGRHVGLFTVATAALPALRFPVKALVPCALCVALLAGLGFDAWSRGSVAARRMGCWVSGVAMALAGALLVAIRAWPAGLGALLLAPGQPAAAALRPLVMPCAEVIVSGLAIVGLAVLSERRPQRSRLAAALIGAVGLIELAAFHAQLNPTAPADLFRWRPDVLRAVDQRDRRRLYILDYVMAGVSRKHLGRDVPFLTQAPASRRELWQVAAAMRAYPVPPVAAAFGIFDSFGRDQLGLQPLPLAQLNAWVLMNDGTAEWIRLLRMGAVSEVVSLHRRGLEALPLVGRWRGPFAEDLYLSAVPDPSPRASLVGRSRSGGLGALLQPGFDPAREVVLPEGSRPLESPGVQGTATILEQRADRVRLDVASSEPAMVVLADTFDPGWKGLVDGAPVPVLPANVAFQGVAVPAGRHVVELRYRPRSLGIGLAISVLAGLGVLYGLRRAPG